MTERVTELAEQGIDELGLPDDVARALKEVQTEIAATYRDSFIELLQAIKQQAAAIDRVQATLNILVEALRPQLGDLKNKKLPAAFRLAADGEKPDVATAVVVSDPIATGYTMSQAELSQALGLPQTDVSILVRAFKIPSDGRCAVRVRQGGVAPMVNYHRRAIDRFLELVAAPPPDLPEEARTTLERVRRRLPSARRE